MKKILLSSPVVVFLFAVAFLSSCSQFGHLDIQKRHYSKGFYVHRSEKQDAVTTAEKPAPSAVVEKAAAPSATVAPVETPAAPVAHPSHAVAVRQQPAKEPNHTARPAAEQPAASSSSAIPEKNNTSAPVILHDRNASSESQSGDVDLVLLVILAILLPPLAVFLKEGDLTVNFVIDLLLCLLFWVPGVVFALLVVFDII